MIKRGISACAVLPIVALLILAAPAPLADAKPPTDPTTSGPTIIPTLHSDTSLPLTAISRGPGSSGLHRVKPHKPIPGHSKGDANPPAVGQPGTATPAIASAPTLLTSFEGIGNGFTGPQGTFSVNSAPPDTNGAVGPNHYAMTVNTDFAIFNKSGTVLYGPVPINTVWSGFGGGCQTNNDGDPTVVYDRIADRWIISQFSVSTTPYLMCVAVSTSADPTGSYYRYSFSYGTQFPDYPKLSVWPDAYYLTVNFFNSAGTAFLGAGVAAMDRAKMLQGQPATQQLFQTSTTYGGLLASTLDGPQLPPSGAPNYVVGLGANTSSLAYWKFHSDFATPANATFTGPATIAIPSYSEACSGGTCVPQSGTSQRLDSLADRIMYRLPYRNFGDHEAILVNHSVAAGSSTGIRWYELRMSGGNLTLFQSGTYAPDAAYRWMGSIAMDGSGGIGLGFSTSSSTTHPGIHYTGRLATDPAGTMTQGEGTVLDGAGSQTANLSRWGDYSAMTIDPADDCTFWYTNEYIPANGTFNWRTRVATFKLPGCGAPPPPSDFSISANPSALTVTAGANGTSTISTAVTSGSAQSVALSASGLPSGATATFNPSSVSAGASSTLTIATSATTPTGTSTVTVTGTGTSATHTTTVTLTVNAPPANDFSISANPTSVSVQQGASGSSTISTAVTSGSAESINLSTSGEPAGTSSSLNPASVTAGGTATLTLNVGSTTAPGSYTITVTGTATSATHSTTVLLTVTAPPPSGINNGTFETGNLSGWTSLGSTAISTTAHAGSYAARVGSTAPFNGDSSIAQTFTAPSAGGTLAFWYRVVCTDTVTYDWATATLRDNTAGTTSTLLPRTCTNNGTWQQASASLTGSHSYTLTLTDRDDNYATDPTYTLYDDVAIGAAPPPPPPPPSGITNGGFETGSLSGWSSSGSNAAVTGAHSGTYAARVGSTSPFSGDASISQTFTAGAGATSLTFWYRVVCTDTVTYDWATATLRDNTTSSTTTMLARTCTNTGAWASKTASVVAGHSYTLTLIDHDDNYPGDPTYTLYDDVTLQ